MSFEEIRRKQTIRYGYGLTPAAKRIFVKLRDSTGPLWFGAKQAKTLDVMLRLRLIRYEISVQADALRGRHKLRYEVTLMEDVCRDDILFHASLKPRRNKCGQEVAK